MHVTPMASSNIEKIKYQTPVDIVEDENQIVNVNIVTNVWGDISTLNFKYVKNTRAWNKSTS
jgi:hypothetical protein